MESLLSRRHFKMAAETGSQDSGLAMVYLPLRLFMNPVCEKDIRAAGGSMAISVQKLFLLMVKLRGKLGSGIAMATNSNVINLSMDSRSDSSRLGK